MEASPLKKNIALSCLKLVLHGSLVLSLLFAVSVPQTASSYVNFSFSVRIAPPPIPIYELPPLPNNGYIWTPGYWAWDPDFREYYWVPGTWVLPPASGLLWTPGYWEWSLGAYLWHPGYWSRSVGYYGGINYGWGYFGTGYQGGYWRDGRFRNQQIRDNYWGRRYSYSGPGGATLRPRELVRRNSVQNRVEMTQQQIQLETLARARPEMRASVNRGEPRVRAVKSPRDFQSLSAQRQTQNREFNQNRELNSGSRSDARSLQRGTAQDARREQPTLRSPQRPTVRSPQRPTVRSPERSREPTMRQPMNRPMNQPDAVRQQNRSRNAPAPMRQSPSPKAAVPSSESQKKKNNAGKRNRETPSALQKQK